MSRKRFIKLMMARGYSQNTAAALATQVSRYGSYAVMYQQYPSIPTLTQILPDMIRWMFNALAVMCDAVATVFSNFAESMRRAADGWEAAAAGYGRPKEHHRPYQ